MDDLITKLNHILELLEQIKAITANQTVVLLGETTEYLEDQSAVGLLEGMVEYKEQLIQEVEYAEEKFDKAYEQYRGKITDEKYVTLFKDKVNQILSLKNEIVESEKSNLVIMLNRNRKIETVMSIPKTPDKIVDIYKKSVHGVSREYK